MKNIVISGSRSITDSETVHFILDKALGDIIGDIRVLHGGAKGVDRLASAWCKKNGVPEQVYLPDWDTHGKAAGPIRNAQMIEEGDFLVAIWDGKSKGTKNAIGLAEKKDIPIRICKVIKFEDGRLAESWPKVGRTGVLIKT